MTRVVLRLVCLLTAVPLATLAQEAAPDISLTATLQDPANLARLRENVASVGMFSSYDRTGGNDDGFSGKYSFIRKEADDRLVLAEVEGPGAITRIWTPTPTNDLIEFYFDGEEQPRLVVPFIDLFRGTTPPFLPPITYAGAGGYVTYAPLEFAHSIKIVARAPRIQFYQINYLRYVAGTTVPSFQPGDTAPAPQVRPPAGAEESVVSESLSPGTTTTLFEFASPGRLTRLTITPIDALTSPDRAIVLRITYDGAERPAVEVPVGDFFGASFGQPSMRSMLIGADENNRGYVLFPMPFEKSLRIELVDQRSEGPPLNVTATAEVSAEPRQDNEAYFHASWTRENPTTTGQPFTFVNLEGQGHLVGVTLQCQGEEPGQTLYFEGDEQVTIDGELVAHGTGSEDFFNGGWYDLPGRWYQARSFPLSGCLEYRKPLGRTGAYRIFLADAFSFRKSLLLTIEHGPERNEARTDYTGVSYYYLDQPSGVAPALPPAPERQATQPKSFVIVPGWQAPIEAFSLDAVTLTRNDERIGDHNVRTLTLRDAGTPQIGDHYLAIVANAPAAGRYKIEIEGVRGPDEGIVQLAVDDQPVGEKVDFYAPERSVSERATLATLDLPAGDTPLYFKLVGKNEESTGRGFALIRIHCTRVDD